MIITQTKYYTTAKRIKNYIEKVYKTHFKNPEDGFVDFEDFEDFYQYYELHKAIKIIQNDIEIFFVTEDFYDKCKEQLDYKGIKVGAIISCGEDDDFYTSDMLAHFEQEDYQFIYNNVNSLVSFIVNGYSNFLVEKLRKKTVSP